MTRTFQIELSLSDLAENERLCFVVSRPILSRVFSNPVFLPAFFGLSFFIFSLITNRGGEFRINDLDLSLYAYFLGAFTLGAVGALIGLTLRWFRQISLKAAFKKAAKSQIKLGLNQFILHVFDDHLKIEEAGGQVVSIDLNKIRDAIPFERSIVVAFTEHKFRFIPRFPSEDFDLWPHLASYSTNGGVIAGPKRLEAGASSP